MWAWILELVVLLLFVGFGGFEGFIAWAVLSALFLFGRYFHNQTQLKAAQVALQADRQQKEDIERALRAERAIGAGVQAPALPPVAATTATGDESAPQGFCRGCSARMPRDATFCDACGRPVASDCPKCGTSNRDGARFCKKCGTALQAETGKAPKAEEAARHAVVRVSVKPRLASEIVSHLGVHRPSEVTLDLQDEGGGYARAGGQSLKITTAEVELLAIAGAQTGDTLTWKCSACGEKNASRRSLCRNCGVAKPKPLPERPASDDSISWSCPKCGTVNAQRRTRCRQCDSWNPN
jgi:uncharacterized OB-fold protein